MRNAVGSIGRVLITVGILILLFVGYQLWGTGLYTARAQDDLKKDFDKQLAQVEEDPLPADELPPAPPDGEAIARIRIAKIGVDWAVVEGTETADLRKGPGHYKGTPMPGEIGNSAIAGHRTTYGAPFWSVDELHVGDKVILRTLTGTYTYVLDRDPFTVKPSQTEVLFPDINKATGKQEATITLTTCNPRFSAAQRLVVRAKLDRNTSSKPVRATKTDTSDVQLAGEPLGGEKSGKLPALMWGVLALFTGLFWWWCFHRYPRWTTWVLGAIPFLVVLFFFYVYFERILPSNY